MSEIRSDRGVTPLVGFILLFALVTVGAMTVVMVGGAALDDTKTEVDTATAEQLFRNVDEKASDIERFSTTSSAAVTVPQSLSGQVAIDRDQAWVNVSVTPPGSTTACDTGAMEMGTMRYDRDGEPVVVYQAGGIFRETDAGVAVESNPSLGYQEGTLQLQLLNFTKDHDASREIVLSNEPRTSAQATKSATKTLRNCLANASSDAGPPTITVEVHSEYASGWHQYFQSAYPDQNTTFWENNDTVKAVFENPDSVDTSAPEDSDSDDASDPDDSDGDDASDPDDSDSDDASDDTEDSDDSDSDDGPASSPSVCAVDDEYSWEYEVENETEDTEKNETERSLEVECAAGSDDVEIEYEYETRTREEFASGGEGEVEQENETEWTYEGDELQEFEQENRTEARVDDDTDTAVREDFLQEQGFSNVSDVRRFELREEVEFEREDEGIEFEYETESRTRTLTDGTNETEFETETDAENSDATMPSFGGPEDVVTTYLDKFEADVICLPNGWCTNMDTASGDPGDAAGDSSDGDDAAPSSGDSDDSDSSTGDSEDSDDSTDDSSTDDSSTGDSEDSDDSTDDSDETVTGATSEGTGTLMDHVDIRVFVVSADESK